MADLYSFVAESNRIEGILRDPADEEINVHEWFLQLETISLRDLERFVESVSGAGLRRHVGMNVRVGRHVPPKGGPEIERLTKEHLAQSVRWERSPWLSHVAYEKLHPFMDGNGRSGRALWAWMRFREDRDPFLLGFLHSAYYEALEASRQDKEDIG